jgi:hypothetical protein
LGNSAIEAQGSQGPSLPPCPESEGYEGVSSYWVAAQDLKAGDKVRQASGGRGTVIALATTQESQAMFNLDVAELDNYYVGKYGWLVHNQSRNNCFTIIGLLDFGTEGNAIFRFFQSKLDSSFFQPSPRIREIKGYVSP